MSDEVTPFPKSAQLARGERRDRRKVASPKQWQAIIEAKGSVCRLATNGNAFHRAEPVLYHHLVERDSPHFGDDVADNIVPLCNADHTLVHGRHKLALYRLAESLSDAERAYCVAKIGPDALERLFGVAR